MTDPDERIDALLREWADQRRSQAPHVSQRPLVAYRPRRVRWIAVATSAAAVAAVATTLALVTSSNGTNAVQQTPATTNSEPPPPPAPPTQQVTYHHLSISVPASWQLNDQHCGAPQGDTVLLPAPVLSCLTGAKPDVTVVRFQDVFEPTIVGKDAQWTDDQVDGHFAHRATGRYSDYPAIVINVPDAQAAVLITAPTMAGAEDLEQTLRVVDVDSYGCQTNQLLVPLLRTPAPTVPGADQSLVPGRPTSLSVCGYEGDLLSGSGQVPNDQLDDSLAMLRGLPPGLSRGPDRDNQPISCTETDDLSLALDRDQTDTPWYEALVHYASGDTLTLRVRLGFCGDLGVSNGAVTAQWSNDLVMFVSRFSHVGAAYPQYTHPAP
jgi:hypothetical protein